MEVALVSNRYGKSRVRLMKVVRHATHHDLYEWAVQVLLTGDFDSAHTEGDNSRLLTTDAMKNTVYSRARASSANTIEQFALELADFLLARNPQVDSAEVHIGSAMWKQVQVNGEPHPSTFMHGSNEVQTTTIARRRESLEIVSGLDHLLILKTSDSAFEGFLKESLTTLPETPDRLLGTVVKADWHYSLPGGGPDGALDFNTLRTTIRETLLRTFAEHKSKSVQHTLYAMGEAALVTVPEIEQIDLLMPNKHCLLVDLARFGQDNPNEIFVPTDEPHGTIEASLRRRT
jgi:urate oxidase